MGENECHQLDERKALLLPRPLFARRLFLSPVALRDRGVFPVPGVARMGCAELARRRRRQRQRGHLLLLLGGVGVGIDTGRRRRKSSCRRRKNYSLGLWLRRAKAEGCRTRRDAERERWGRQRSGSRKKEEEDKKTLFFREFGLRAQDRSSTRFSLFFFLFSSRSPPLTAVESPRVRQKAFSRNTALLVAFDLSFPYLRGHDVNVLDITPASSRRFKRFETAREEAKSWSDGCLVAKSKAFFSSGPLPPRRRALLLFAPRRRRQETEAAVAVRCFDYKNESVERKMREKR